MDQVIWIEILSRQNHVVARFRCAGLEIRIGRGYGNDVVIDDPYVAPEHLKLRRNDDGALIAEDLGSANGLFLADSAQRMSRIVLDGDARLRIGHTVLRVREASHTVEPERTAKPISSTWPLAAVLVAATIAVDFLLVWLSETTEPRGLHYLAPLASLAGLGILWAAIWAVFSRIFAGQVRLERHLALTFGGLLVYMLFGTVMAGLAFSFSWHVLTPYQFAAGWCFLACVCFFQLRAISDGRLVLKAGIVAGLAAIAIAIQAANLFDLRAANQQLNQAQNLLPPMLRLAPVKDENAFFAQIESMKRKLDQDRAEEPAASTEAAGTAAAN